MTNYRILIVLFLSIFIQSCSEDTVGVEIKGSLTGVVTDKVTDDPLEGVKVTTNPASTTVFTDASGAFSFSEILVDDYSVQAELEGYTTGFEPVVVLEGETSNVAIELETSSTNVDPPSKPELVFPEDNAEDVELSLEFLWNPSTSSASSVDYTLELRNGTTNELRVFEVAQDTMVTVENLQIATIYFWQVTADDGDNDPVVSDLNAFRTLTIPNNPFLFVREEEGNNVIFSGGIDGGATGMPDVNVIQLTDDATNSFRPKKNNDVNKIAFLRTLGADTHLFTMNFDGTDVQQVTTAVPVTGFRLRELDFAWANNGGRLYYPNNTRLLSIRPDGGDRETIYQTNDGSLISEVAVTEFDPDLLVIKTNDVNGYSARIYTYRLSTSTIETIILEGELGGAGGIDITANGDKILFNRDVSGSQNASYRFFQSRLFIYDFALGGPPQPVTTDTSLGENDFDGQFSPSEGDLIWTRKASNFNALPAVYTRSFQAAVDDVLLFTEAFMADWE